MFETISFQKNVPCNRTAKSQHQHRTGGEPGDGKGDEKRRRQKHCFRVTKQLSDDVARQIAVTRCSCHNQTGRQRDHECRHLRDQSVADGQRGKNLDRLAEVHVVLDHAHVEAAGNVDQCNHNAGNGIAANELAGTIHGPVEVGLLSHLFPPRLRLFLRNQTGVHVRVDGHLLSRHSIECESGGHFANTRGTFGNHQELNGDQYGEDDQPDDNVAPGNEFAERLNYAAGSMCSVGSRASQNQSCRGDVQHQAGQSGAQQNGRKNAEFEWSTDVDGGEQDDNGYRHVAGQQQVHQQRRQRRNDDQHRCHNQHREDQSLCAQKQTAHRGRCLGGHPYLDRSNQGKCELDSGGREVSRG